MINIITRLELRVGVQQKNIINIPETFAAKRFRLFSSKEKNV